MNKNLRAIVIVIGSLFIALAALFMFVDPRSYDGSVTKVTNARFGSQIIQKACKAYRAETGFYPKQLADLIVNKQFLEGGERALIDPWGKPYQFEIVRDPNGTGEDFPVVFTTDPQGRK